MNILDGEKIEIYFNKVKKEVNQKIESYDYKQLKQFNDTDIDECINYFKVPNVVIDYENYEKETTKSETKKYNNNYQYYGGIQEYYNVPCIDINIKLPIKSGAFLLFYSPTMEIIYLRHRQDIHFNVYSGIRNKQDNLSFKLSIEMSELKGKTEEEKQKIFLNEFNDYVKELKDKVAHLNKDIDKFNQSLKELINKEILKKIEQDAELALFSSAIGIDVKPLSEQAKSGMKIMITPRKIELPQKKNCDEYFIENQHYDNVLSTIRRHLICTEELPIAIRKLNDEELIRDTILWTLRENFFIASGESFRVNGKTDICVDYNDKTAFIAECKIWHGKNKLIEAIDQIYGYTTWRDCRIAIIIFNLDNKDFGVLCKNLEQSIKDHEDYISLISKNGKNEWKCKFKNRLDSTASLIIDFIVANYYDPNKQ